MDKIDKKEVFVYLETLRKSALINMVGAAPSIMQEFNISRTQASKLLREWMIGDPLI